MTNSMPTRGSAPDERDPGQASVSDAGSQRGSVFISLAERYLKVQ
ncbi:hypothetical protein JJ691_66150 [Kutzneria sp. CA-103260]|nr:hypothetical protein JJ691_66150 [Kutzneria sp. CA-103260]